MAHAIPIWLVDAFSDRNFGGNPAAVCELAQWLPDERLLAMAREHNQSETAFSCAMPPGSVCAGSPPAAR